MERSASVTEGNGRLRRFWLARLAALTAFSLFIALPPLAFAQVSYGPAGVQPGPQGPAIQAGAPYNAPPGYPAGAAVQPPAGAALAPLPTAYGQVKTAGQAPAATDPGDLDSRIKAEVERLVNDRFKAEDEKRKLQKQEEDAKKEAEKSQGNVVGSKPLMPGSWRNGLWFENVDKSFTFHVGGAVQYDLATYTADPALSFGPRGAGAFNDGVNVRRGRLRAEGTMWENIDYRFELEFFNGVLPAGSAPDTSRQAIQQAFVTPGPTDAYFTITKLPVIGNVRIGNQKEPISLEHLESFRFLPFLERSPLFDFLTPTAFNNGFNPGILLFNTMFNDRMTWAVGGFKNSYDVYGFGVGDGEYAVTGRLTALPWYEQEGKYLLHLGVAGSTRDPVQDQNRFRVRTSARNAPAPATPFVNVLIDTGFFNTTHEDLLGVEFFMNLGPLTLQAEWQAAWNMNSFTPATGLVGTTFYQGSYVQALYWLTHEYTRWDKKAAAPDRYVVNSPFYLLDGLHGVKCCPGAWQLAARYSYVDTNSRGINGGTLSDLTLGVNWILNPNTKIQWNYDYATRGGLGAANNGDLHAFGMRMQFDF